MDDTHLPELTSLLLTGVRFAQGPGTGIPRAANLQGNPQGKAEMMLPLLQQTHLLKRLHSATDPPAPAVPTPQRIRSGCTTIRFPGEVFSGRICCFK